MAARVRGQRRIGRHHRDAGPVALAHGSQAPQRPGDAPAPDHARGEKHQIGRGGSAALARRKRARAGSASSLPPWLAGLVGEPRVTLSHPAPAEALTA